jgi:hypothetical protein
MTVPWKLQLKALFICINGHEERKLSLSREQKKILNDFQSEQTRLSEEQFAQILTERSDVRLFFINENKCFTDGRNITIDPGEMELFVDKKALLNAEKHLRLNNKISSDPWLALKMQTRASNIHESLHIIYSNFSFKFYTDARAGSEIQSLVLCDIRNTIEDSFIEAAGCSLYDNLEHYLLWNRIALFCCEADLPDTLEQRFEKAGIKVDTKTAYEKIETVNEYEKSVTDDDNVKFAKLIVYLNYMTFFVLYPFFKLSEAPKPVFEYVEKTKPLFSKAVLCGNANERDEYVFQIFDIIEPLIPDDKKLRLPDSVKYLLDDLRAGANNNTSINSKPSNGKNVEVTRRLFTDNKNEPVPFNSSREKLENDIESFLSEKEKLRSVQKNEQSITTYNFNNFDCSNLHKKITIEVIKPKINKNLKRAYQNMVTKYQLQINSYSTQIFQYLKANIEEKEEKKIFGSGISSKNLSDTKKRYWYRKNIQQGIPDIGFLFLVDGSGSMEGGRMDNVMASMVIIHEVFKRNNIQHSIVEHRAIYGENKLIHNILIDFQYRDEEQYNILGLKADEGTREGFSLYWAEKHINKQCSSEYKTIIMISDGVPAHTCDGTIDYVPPLSVKDTAETVKKIIRRGTPIVAIALDDPGDDECYQQLKIIYPDVVSCVDIGKLTGQLLRIISNLFQGRFK